MGGWCVQNCTDLLSVHYITATSHVKSHTDNIMFYPEVYLTPPHFLCRFLVINKKQDTFVTQEGRQRTIPRLFVSILLPPF